MEDFWTQLEKDMVVIMISRKLVYINNKIMDTPDLEIAIIEEENSCRF